MFDLTNLFRTILTAHCISAFKQVKDMKKSYVLFLVLFSFLACKDSTNEQPEGTGCDFETANVVVEEPPFLIGGIAAVQEKLQYPEMALRAGIQGKVIVQFVVTDKGEVKEPRVIKGIGGGCDEAALAAAKQAEFEPGKIRGIPVCTQYSLPITFRLPHN